MPRGPMATERALFTRDTLLLPLIVDALLCVAVVLRLLSRIFSV